MSPLLLVSYAGFIPKNRRFLKLIKHLLSTTYNNDKIMTQKEPKKTIKTFYNPFGQKNNPFIYNGLSW